MLALLLLVFLVFSVLWQDFLESTKHLPHTNSSFAFVSSSNQLHRNTAETVNAVTDTSAHNLDFVWSSVVGKISVKESVTSRSVIPIGSDIFPDEQERAKFYSGRWFDFSHYDDEELILARKELCRISKQTNKHNPHMVMDKVQALRRVDLEGCKDKHPYCKDSLDLFEAGISDFVLVHFGDKPEDVHHVPFFSKMREASRRRGILWPLNVQRHFGTLAQVDRDDCQWREKRQKIVWRGADTGYDGERERVVRDMFSNPDPDVDIAFGPVLLNPELKKFSRGSLSPKQMLQNKYLLSLEGNDVASGLKWMLYSASVVMMHHTRFETWGMESLLRPYVHYIPVYRNLSNLSEQLAWAKLNDDASENISKTATNFMKKFWRYSSVRIRNVEIETELKAKIVQTYQRAMSQLLADNFTLAQCSGGEGVGSFAPSANTAAV